MVATERGKNMINQIRRVVEKERLTENAEDDSLEGEPTPDQEDNCTYEKICLLLYTT